MSASNAASLSRTHTNLKGTRTWATTLDGRIDLTDNTEVQPDTAVPTPEERDSDAETEDIPAALQKTASWVPNAGKLRQELARRKYAKYSEERYSKDASRDSPNSEPQGSASDPASKLSTNATNERGTTLIKKDGHIRRGQQKVRDGQQMVKDLIRHRKRRTIRDNDMEIDVLYENQRGSWLFGAPLFSGKSLLNFDPSPWTDATGHPSAVDITNAQLPDPNWEWVWKTWYVDMSLDVDEQGWQYSFMFQNRFPWHGTHRWLYSFVRRRRWIRKRARRYRDGLSGALEGITSKSLAPTYKLNADYFSVHAVGQLKKSAASFDNSTTGNLNFEQAHQTDEAVDDMPTLLSRLKAATVDREKLNLVLQYMELGGVDTQYLAEEMPHIMSYFMFQHSRRQLIAMMAEKVDERKEKGVSKGDKDKQPEMKESRYETLEVDEEREQRKMENLTRATEVADQQIKNLEYWSDIRETTREGKSLGTGEEVLESGGLVGNRGGKY